MHRYYYNSGNICKPFPNLAVNTKHSHFFTTTGRYLVTPTPSKRPFLGGYSSYKMVNYSPNFYGTREFCEGRRDTESEIKTRNEVGKANTRNDVRGIREESQEELTEQRRQQLPPLSLQTRRATRRWRAHGLTKQGFRHRRTINKGLLCAVQSRQIIIKVEG